MASAPPAEKRARTERPASEWMHEWDALYSLVCSPASVLRASACAVRSMIGVAPAHVYAAHGPRDECPFCVFLERKAIEDETADVLDGIPGLGSICAAYACKWAERKVLPALAETGGVDWEKVEADVVYVYSPPRRHVIRSPNNFFAPFELQETFCISPFVRDCVAMLRRRQRDPGRPPEAITDTRAGVLSHTEKSILSMFTEGITNRHTRDTEGRIRVNDRFSVLLDDTFTWPRALLSPHGSNFALRFEDGHDTVYFEGVSAEHGAKHAPICAMGIRDRVYVVFDLGRREPSAFYEITNGLAACTADYRCALELFT